MRDDIGKLNMPASSKRYARMSGISWTQGNKKQNLRTQMVATLTNGGRTQGFPNKDAVGPVRMASPLAKKIAGKK
jgi:hypothetical protein